MRSGLSSAQSPRPWGALATLVGAASLCVALGGCVVGQTLGADATDGEVARPDVPRVPTECEPGEAGFLSLCACDEACAPSAPRCTRNAALEPSGPDYCTTDCEADPAGCPEGSECLLGAAAEGRPFCHRCLSDVIGAVPLGERCACDSDCAPTLEGRATRCDEGACARVGCTPGDPTSCPAEHFCEEATGLRTYCAMCSSASAAGEGETCGCTGDCGSGLVCRAAACRRPCEANAACEPLTCIYRTDESPSCQEDGACIAAGGRGPGAACGCNADCGPSAPFCLLGAIAGEAIERCARPCDPAGDPCPTGTRCCGADGIIAPTCLPNDLLTRIGDTLQCAS